MKEKNRPLKAKGLKIIDHLGALYATFDGSKYWTIENYVFKVLQMCDGKHTLDQIAERIALMSEYDVEDIKIGLKPIFEEFERTGFIVYI